MDNKIEKIETNEAEILASSSPAPAAKVKKRTALKVVAATFYSVITYAAGIYDRNALFMCCIHDH